MTTRGLGLEPGVTAARPRVETLVLPLILAALAGAADLDPRIGPFVAGYVPIPAVGGPLLASRASQLSRRIPRRLLAGAS